ncbi:MAG: hypothetical protein JWM85_1497 [Acidimicrobiaceae bacterium]|nr:hypothetical protein [Acidimicrobiaceae bacterium]
MGGWLALRLPAACPARGAPEGFRTTNKGLFTGWKYPGMRDPQWLHPRAKPHGREHEPPAKVSEAMQRAWYPRAPNVGRRRSTARRTGTVPPGPVIAESIPTSCSLVRRQLRPPSDRLSSSRPHHGGRGNGGEGAVARLALHPESYDRGDCPRGPAGNGDGEAIGSASHDLHRGKLDGTGSPGTERAEGLAD